MEPVDRGSVWISLSALLIDPANNDRVYISLFDVIPSGYLYDFVVPDWNNYIAAGIVHHNTGKSTSGAFELSCHLTGYYPEWWEGKTVQKADHRVGVRSVRVANPRQFS